MRLLALLLLLALQPSSCAKPAPPLEPLPKPEPAPVAPAEAGVPRRSLCQQACDRMLALHCVPITTPGGKSCEDVFCPTNAGWDFRCMARAVSCLDLDRCNNR